MPAAHHNAISHEENQSSQNMDAKEWDRTLTQVTVHAAAEKVSMAWINDESNSETPKHQNVRTTCLVLYLYLQLLGFVPLHTQLCWSPWPAHLCPWDVESYSGNTGSVSHSTLAQTLQWVLAAGTKVAGCELIWLAFITQMAQFHRPAWFLFSLAPTTP